MKIEAIHDYTIQKRLPSRGLADIFLAEDQLLNRSVWLHVLQEGRRQDSESVHRFLRQAQLLARFHHPCIPPVYLYGADGGGVPFQVTPVLAGRTLKSELDALAQGTVEPTESRLRALLHIFRDVCRAIGHAHSQDILHRNLSPENVLLGKDGGVLVQGWEYCKDLKDASDGGAYHLPFEVGAEEEEFEDAYDSGYQTMAGVQMAGLGEYIAPEQADSDLGTVDERADIYALGGVLYHILALRSPTEARNDGGLPPPAVAWPRPGFLARCVGATGIDTDAWSVAALSALVDEPAARPVQVANWRLPEH